MSHLNEHILHVWTNGKVKRFFAESELNPRTPKMKFFSIVTLNDNKETYTLVYGTIDLEKGKWVYNRWNRIEDQTSQDIITYYTRISAKCIINDYELY